VFEGFCPFGLKAAGEGKSQPDEGGSQPEQPDRREGNKRPYERGTSSRTGGRERGGPPLSETPDWDVGLGQRSSRTKVGRVRGGLGNRGSIGPDLRGRLRA